MNKVAIIGTGQTKFSKEEKDVETLLLESTNNCINSIETVSYTHLTLPTSDLV